MQLHAVSRDPGIRFLRISVAGLLFIHGVGRLLAGGVAPFGEFLNLVGIPLGLAVAWLLTIVEIVGCPLLAAGFFVRPLLLWLGIELIAGIALVHAREGWWVVGLGRNGVEYSVLLILAMIAIWIAERSALKAQ